MKRLSYGFSLIEILVALVVISIGFLGAAALQAKALHAEMESYQRSQALFILEDIINRIEANRSVASCYAISQASGTPYLGTSNASTFTCSSGGTSALRTVADDDLLAWDATLKGASITSNGQNVAGMNGARGCVSYDSVNDVYTISVAWQGQAPTVAPTDQCASGLYGDEKLRRVITRSIEIADLD